MRKYDVTLQVRKTYSGFAEMTGYESGEGIQILALVSHGGDNGKPFEYFKTFVLDDDVRAVDSLRSYLKEVMGVPVIQLFRRVD